MISGSEFSFLYIYIYILLFFVRVCLPASRRIAFVVCNTPKEHNNLVLINRKVYRGRGRKKIQVLRPMVFCR